MATVLPFVRIPLVKKCAHRAGRGVEALGELNPAFANLLRNADGAIDGKGTASGSSIVQGWNVTTLH